MVRDLLFTGFALVFVVLTAWTLTDRAKNPTFYLLPHRDQDD